MKLQFRLLTAAAVLLLASYSPVNALAVEYKEADLLSVLKSDAPPAEKAITCKRLAVFGTAQSVPALAPLLENAELSSWARIALEAIPGPEADKALRDALDKVNGRLLVGVINSIAVRRDQKAVRPLTQKMNGADADVAAAAAIALGRIGGPDAAKVLTSALPKASAQIRSAVALGCILAGENYLNAGKPSQARKLYELVSKSEDIPKQRRLEAVRGTILARGDKGITLLLEQLRSTDKDRLAIGLRTARELKGRNVTKALADELNRTSPDRQARLLLALADRGDAAAVPAILNAARTGSTPVRLAAVGVLEKIGNASAVPVLLDMAISPDPALAQAAKNTLIRLPGAETDADLQQRLASSSGKMRQTLIEIAGRRQIASALPEITRSISASDPAVRSAAIQAVGQMGAERDAQALIDLLKRASDEKERADLETALLAICGRSGGASARFLVPMAQSGSAQNRIVALHALASAGGSEALAAVKTAVNDSDAAVQDEAVRTLSSWPNTWPEDQAVAQPLLALARDGKKTSHQVLAVRGYLQYLQSAKDLSEKDKVTKIDEVMPLLRRPEEKRLAIPILQPIATAESLDLLSNFAGDAAVADDACSAIVRISGSRNQSIAKASRQKALQVVMDKCGNDSTKKRAERLLADLR